jgi:diguanylate cyclase (GGDEF)-like protein
VRQEDRQRPFVGHPARVETEPALREDSSILARLGMTERGPEHGVSAVALAVLLVVGGVLGLLNLPVDGVVEDSARRVYTATMAACLLMAAVLFVRRRAGVWTTFALVLLGDLIYVVVSLSVADPLRHSTPLMLLFAAFIAAWFLGPWMLTVHMLVTPLACAIALWDSYDTWAALLIQVVVSAGMLNSASLGVFVLRRRIQRLLVATEAASWVDPLTGLHNRRYLAEQASRVWRQARRDGTRVVAMVLDLDHFKNVNDAHGHAAGDALLQAVSRSLAATVRPADLLARTGGEEIVVIGMVSDSDEAARLGERLRAAVAQTRTDGGHRVTASIGVALIRPVDGEDAPASMWRLIDRADAAMYVAKRAGRDRVSAVRVPPQRTARYAGAPHGLPVVEPPATT